MNTLNKIISACVNNTTLYFRVVLFFCFIGHGLVSLGYSPGLKLHLDIVNPVNITPWESEVLVNFLGVWDLMLAFLIGLNVFPKVTLGVAIFYVSCVAISAFGFYYSKTGKIFGFAEVMRRFPWLCFLSYLLLSIKNHNPSLKNVLRLGVGFSFLSHGLASLGVWGLNAGHIELANQILVGKDVATYVFWSGIYDTCIGTLLVLGIYSQFFIRMSLPWLVVVVVVSFMTGFPDGLFRTSFLLAGIYIAFDKECHSLSLLKKTTI